MDDNVTLYDLRDASDADYAFMQHVKLTGLRPYVEELWGWDQEFQEAHFREVFEAEQSQIITVDGQDAGFIVVTDEESELFLAGIYLSDLYRGKGIGAAVILDILERGREAQKPVTLSVLTPNPARRLYERLGS